MSEINPTIVHLIAEDLELANSKYPAFASAHEGYAVLKEEVEEADAELMMLKVGVNVMWSMIKNNRPTDEVIEYASRIKKDAMHGIEELIQVAAMCDKFSALENPAVIENHHTCSCGGQPMAQEGLDQATNLPIHRIECCSCHKMTIWHRTEKCAWCEWGEMREDVK